MGAVPWHILIPPGEESTATIAVLCIVFLPEGRVHGGPRNDLLAEGGTAAQNRLFDIFVIVVGSAVGWEMHVAADKVYVVFANEVSGIVEYGARRSRMFHTCVRRRRVAAHPVQALEGQIQRRLVEVEFSERNDPFAPLGYD